MRYFLLFLGVVLLSSCSKKTKDNLPLANSHGHRNEVVLVMDDSLWIGSVGDGYEKITGYYYDPNMDRYFYATVADHVHMNWGWGGSKNGWYDYDTWENLAGVVVQDVQFIYNQEMIYNITPN